MSKKKWGEFIGLPIISALAGIVVCLLFPNHSIAQPESALHKFFGGPGFEEAREVIALPDGGYAVVGTTSSTPDNDTDIFLMKLDAGLNCEWTMRYPGIGVENARALTRDNEGNYILCGFTNTYAQQGYDAIIIKTDSNGNELWRLAYGGEDWDFGNDIAVDTDGKIVVCGETFSEAIGGSDGFVISISADGSILDEMKSGYSGADIFNSVIILDGLLFVGGATDHFSQNNLSEAWILAFDMELQSQWEFHFPGGGESEIYGLKPGTTGLMACGYRKAGNHRNALVLTSDINGDVQVLVDGEDITTDYAIRDLCVWPDGFMIGGSQNGFGAGENDIMLQERNSTGAWVIGHTLGQGGDDEIYSINITPDLGAVVAGVTYSHYETAGAQAYIIRLSSVYLGTFYTNSFSTETCIDFINGTEDIQANTESIFVSGDRVIFMTNQNEKIPVSVMDMSGKICLRKSVSPGESIDISFLRQGLYIVRAEFRSGIRSGKIQRLY